MSCEFSPNVMTGIGSRLSLGRPESCLKRFRFSYGLPPKSFWHDGLDCSRGVLFHDGPYGSRGVFSRWGLSSTRAEKELQACLTHRLNLQRYLFVHSVLCVFVLFVCLVIYLVVCARVLRVFFGFDRVVGWCGLLVVPQLLLDLQGIPKKPMNANTFFYKCVY